MPEITFESSDGSQKKTVNAPDGGALADLCDDHAAPIPFSCRSASCATCHIEVLDVLDAVCSKPPRFRLACCAKLRAGAGRVIVRAQNEY
jgi:ferredoxin